MPAYQIALACVADLVFGDPQWFPHPVRFFGFLIAAGENLLRSLTKSKAGLLLAGGVLALSLTVSLGLGSWLVSSWVNHLSPVAGAIVTIYLACSTLSLRSLDEAGCQVMERLRRGRIEDARACLAMIVGRDTRNLCVCEMIRAVIETVAENSSDGVVAPLFYLTLGGVPGALAYKVINTMDSMIGYKNERYLYFGKVAARLDDLANFIPSRLTAGLTVLVAAALGMPWRNALRVVLRDAGKQPSPNSGYPEAAFAGALRVRLGGTSFYGGIESRKAYLGEPERTLSCDVYRDMRRLLYGTCALALLICLAVSALNHKFL